MVNLLFCSDCGLLCRTWEGAEAGQTPWRDGHRAHQQGDHNAFFCFWCSLLAYHSMMLSQRWNCTQNTPILNTTLIISHRFWFSLKPSENVMSWPGICEGMGRSFIPWLPVLSRSFAVERLSENDSDKMQLQVRGDVHPRRQEARGERLGPQGVQVFHHLRICGFILHWDCMAAYHYISRAGKTQILVATDVAARGLGIWNIISLLDYIWSLM